MTTVNQIVPLDDVKLSLRIETDDDDLDALLSTQIAAAVDHTERYTGRKFIDQQTDRLVAVPCSKILYHRDPSIDANTVTLMNGEDAITPSRISYRDHCLFVWAPDAGWPRAADDEYPYYLLSYTRKTDPDDFPQSLKHACIVLVRQLFDGLSEFKTNSVYRILADPYVVYLQD